MKLLKRKAPAFSPLLRSLTAAAAVLAAFSTAHAAVITNGFTYAVASAGGYGTTGTHFHSNTGGAFGNPAGKAEVGNFGSENVRGLSEYNLTGLSAGSAFVTFNVFKLGGLFAGTNDVPFSGTVNVYAYQGNNAEDIGDFQAAGSLVGSFSTGGLAVGNIISMDITSAFGTAISGSWSSLGIRLQVDSNGGNVGTDTQTGKSRAVTFDTFRLTSDNQSTVSTPDGGSTIALLGLALTGLCFAARRRIV